SAARVVWGHPLPAVGRTEDEALGDHRCRRRPDGAKYGSEHEPRPQPAADSRDDNTGHYGGDRGNPVGPSVDHLAVRRDAGVDGLDPLVEEPEIDLALLGGEIGILELLNGLVERGEFGVEQRLLI